LLFRALSEMAAASGLNWLAFSHVHGAAAPGALPAWISVPNLTLMTVFAALDALTVVVVAGLVATAYQSVTASEATAGQDQAG
jgi:hypothetical protein